jgi:hypothetical protein
MVMLGRLSVIKAIIHGFSDCFITSSPLKQSDERKREPSKPQFTKVVDDSNWSFIGANYLAGNVRNRTTRIYI